ncbi:hypothetical protein NIES2119_20005 [[Phormidium ambiguum] IAM M-71]|uniref:DUF4351 domain-containing protein n=2 Tax=[Phormidium ambiguum] IAM M-71 TaxID=454136 RepID=A0A1U7IF44_9CYAN|nr:hypothetical protein NIES2119_20005 [Phormidium ambiguum IAM M-71]
MIDHDRLFKELLTTFFFQFIELFFPEVATYLERDSLTFLDKEIFTDVTAGEQYEADLVAKVRFRGEESFFLIHTLPEGMPEAEVGCYMFTRFTRLYEKYGFPVYPVVIFPYYVPLHLKRDTYRLEFVNQDIVRFNYKVIYLAELHWRDFLHYRNPVAIALMAKMRVAPEERLTVITECLRMMGMVTLDSAKKLLIARFVDANLPLPAVEGRKFLLSLLMNSLKRCLGEISSEVEARICNLSIEQIAELGKEQFKFSDAADLVDWLDREVTN